MDVPKSIAGYEKEAPVQVIEDESTRKAGIRLMVKREDLVFPEISGNKWRKLKNNLLEARKMKKDTLLTFGGAYSNHIHATAAAGNYFGFKTIGIIRGAVVYPLNPTLSFAAEKGMQLEFVNRSLYRDKAALLGEISYSKTNTYTLPEGGTNVLAMKGTAEIVTETPSDLLPDIWAVCCGTGGTIAGMIPAVPANQNVLGISVLKGEFMRREIESLLIRSKNREFHNWSVNTSYHFGGYAKWNPELIRFINDFKKQHQIPLDPVYTGKLFYAVYDLMVKGYFAKGTSVMLIHTGGLQGITGFNERFGNLIT